MTSRRSWLLGLALGAAVTVGSMQDAHAQVPRTFTYQGQLLNAGQPDNGTHLITLKFYTDDDPVNPIATVPNAGVVVTDGIFNIEVGQALTGGLPASLTLNEQYFVGVSIDGGAELPRTRLHSAPYAINSNSVNGIEASTTPQPGKLYPLNALGKIDPAVLPPAVTGVTSINGVGPTAGGNVDFVAGSGIVLAPNTGNNTITISAAGGSGIDKIVVGDGLIGGGTANTDGEVFISLAPNAVDASMIGNGVITGMKLNALIAGEGLYQDILGNLNVGVDNQSLEINADVLRIKALGVGTTQLADGAVTRDKIADGAVNAQKVDPTSVQLRVTGTAPSGSFITAVNQNGSVNFGTVTVNPTLIRTTAGSDVNLALNLANPNVWTGAQTFSGGATASTLTVTGATTTNGITNTGNITNSGAVNTATLNTTGNVVVGGTLAVTGATTLTGPATTNGITNNGTVTTTTSNTTGNSTVGGTLTVTGATTTNGITNNGNVGTTTLSTTGAATVGTTLAVGGAITAPAGGHLLGTTGTDQTVLTIRGVPGAGNVELNVLGDANITGTTNLANTTVTTLTATNVNTQNLGGNGGNITLTSDVNATGRTINNGTYSNYTLNNGTLALGSTLTNNGTISGGTINGATLNNYTLNTGSIAVGQTLSNNGTITGGNITNATVTGGTINNTIIGNTTPAAGTFTLLTSNALATLQQLQVNTTSQFNGLSAFGQNPPTNGNKVVINGIVTPTPIGSSADYELVVNGDAQVTGSLWVNNFSSNILSAPLIKFDKAEPFTPGGDMTFGAGNVIFDGAGLVGDVVNITNIPGGAYGMHIMSQAGTSGMKITGAPGSLTALDIDPFATGINVDATAVGINIINAPISIQATGIIDAKGTIVNTLGAVTVNDAFSQTGGQQNTFSGNVDANAGLDVIGATTLTGTVTQSGGQNTFGGNVDANSGLDVVGLTTLTGAVTQSGGQNTFGGNVDANSGLDVVGLTTHNGDVQFLGAGNTISNNASTQVTIADGINQTGGATNNFSGTIAGAAAGNTLGNGANATQLTVNGVIGGANELVVNGDANITGTLTSGGISMAGDIDMNAFDINDLDDLQFSQAGSEISNIGGAVTVNDAFTQIGGQQITLSGNVDANNGLDVVGASTFAGTMQQTGGGQITLSGNVDANNGLDVVGASTFAGTMTQTGGGQITLSGNVDANNGLDVVGPTTMVGSLTQSGGNVQMATTAGNTTTIGNATGAMNLTANLLTIAAPITQTGAGQITLSGNVDANNGLDVVGPTTMVGSLTQSAGNVILASTAGNTTTIGNATGAASITGSTIANTATTTMTNTAGTSITNTAPTITNNGNTTINGTLTQGGAGNQVTLNGNVDATNGLDVTGPTTMVGSLTQSAGNVILASTAGNTTAIGNTTGTMSLTGSTITVAGTTNVNTANDLSTSIGNAAGATNNTTIGVGTAGNLTLNGIDADAVPTQWLTLNGTNQVRTTAIAGTANEGVSWDAVQGRYELGGENNTAVPFAVANRFVNMAAGNLNFTRNNGTETAMLLNGGASGAVTVQGQIGNLNLGNAAGTNTISGHTIANGTGAGAFDVVTINNVPSGQDGLQIDAGQGALSGVNVNTSGTGLGVGHNTTMTNTGATNRGYVATVQGAGTNNIGFDANVQGTGAVGLRVNGNSTSGSVGANISGVNTGVAVTALTSAGTGYNVALTGGLGNQTGVQVSMNGGVSGDNGLSINGVGSGTGASIAMSGSGGTGVNITSVGSGTGVEVGNVTGGGIGVSSSYTGTGTGSAIAGSSSSTNTQSAAIRAQGFETGAAAINITGGDLKSTAVSGTGISGATTQHKIADVRTVQAGENGFATVTVFNALAKANSTIIVTVQEAGTVGTAYISNKAAGSFNVTSTATWDTGDIINYMIVNPD